VTNTAYVEISRSVARGFIALVCLAALTACGDRETQRRVDAWLACDECIGQQRQRVAARGDRAVSALATHLRAPPAGYLEGKRRQFAESYQPSAALSRDEYVGRMLESYAALTQSRAALSLGDIRTPRAQAELSRALAEAGSRGYRRDVVQTIAASLARASHGSFDGTLGVTRVDFGDTVRVHAGSIAWDGNESAELHGSPFGNDVFLRRFMTPGGDDSLEFVAIGELGAYAVAVTGLGAADETQVDTTLRITSMGYTVHTPASADVLTQGMLPQVRYLVLGATGGDTLDYLRVEPTVPLSVTATARSPGAGAVDLAWRSCTSGGPVPGTAAGRVVSDAGTPVGGANVSVVGTLLSGFTAANGGFALAGIPPAAITAGMITLRVMRNGYAPRTFRVPPGTTDHVLGVSATSPGSGTTVGMVATTAAIPAGGCRLLQAMISHTGRHRIVQIKLSP
jgi:hypothetical protein